MKPWSLLCGEHPSTVDKKLIYAEISRERRKRGERETRQRNIDQVLFILDFSSSLYEPMLTQVMSDFCHLQSIASCLLYSAVKTWMSISVKSSIDLKRLYRFFTKMWDLINCPY